MFKKILPLALLSLTSVAYAADSAGLFVEPMLTYEKGESDVDYPAPFGGSDGKVDGFGVGARLGFHVMESLFIGADGRYSKPEFDNDDPDFKTDATAYNYGPVVGVQMPTLLGLRVWGSYILGGEMDLEKKNDVDLKLKDASGYRVGAGVKIGPASLNLEYQQISYDKTELEDAGIFSGSTNNVDAEIQSYIVSVSFPLSL